MLGLPGTFSAPQVDAGGRHSLAVARLVEAFSAGAPPLQQLPTPSPPTGILQERGTPRTLGRLQDGLAGLGRIDAGQGKGPPRCGRAHSPGSMSRTPRAVGPP